MKRVPFKRKFGVEDPRDPWKPRDTGHRTFIRSAQPKRGSLEEPHGPLRGTSAPQELQGGMGPTEHAEHPETPWARSKEGQAPPFKTPPQSHLACARRPCQQGLAMLLPTPAPTS